MAASASRGGGSGPNSGIFAAESCVKTGLSRSDRMFTGTGPTPSSKTILVVPGLNGTAPMCAST